MEYRASNLSNWRTAGGWASPYLLAVLVIILLLAGCGGGDGAASETDADGSEDGDVPSEEQESEEAPASSGGDELEIAFVGESSATDAIWSFAVEEMQNEAEELGANFTFRFAEGDFSRQAQMIDEEVARGADAILATFFDPTAANAAVGRALDEGVAVYALLGVPDLDEEELAKIGTVQSDWEEYGRAFAEITLPQVDEDAQILWPAEDPAGTYITGAVDGFEQYAEEQGRTAKVEILDASSDGTTSASRQLAYLTANPETDAVVTTGSIAIAAGSTAMRQGSLDPGSPPLAGFITSAQAYQGVKDGYIEKGIWPGLDSVVRQGMRDVAAMVRDEAEPAQRAPEWVVVGEDNVDDVIPEGLRQ